MRPSPVVSNRLYGKALFAADSGNWLKALQYLHLSCEQYPSDDRAFRLMGEIYLQQDQPAAAQKVLKKAQELAPDNLETLFTLGNAYLMMGHYRRALKLYLYLERYVEEPSPELFFHIALTYYHQREGIKALHYLEETLDEDPSFIEAYELMGGLYLEAEDLEKAKWALTELLELEPDHLQAHQMLKKIHTKERKRRKALTVVSKCPESR
jgi:tetratricopeptide (TPR) repeat protein